MTSVEEVISPHHFSGITLEGAIFEMGQALETSLPPDTAFTADLWNVIGWVKSPGRGSKSNLNFGSVKNLDLRVLIKVYILYSRARKSTMNKGFGFRSARLTLDAALALDLALGNKSPQHWSDADFQKAERRLSRVYAPATASRRAFQLQILARWFTIHTNLRLSYISGLKDVPQHGLQGTEKGRAEKLIPLVVLRDLLELAVRDLPIRDRFFLMSLVLLIATGMRINELMSLPCDCIIRQGDAVGLRYFVEKVCSKGVKWLAPGFLETTLAALKFLKEFTEAGRAAARLVRAASTGDLRMMDWPAIYTDEQATVYFLSLLLHDWTTRPRNNLFNTAGIWCEKKKTHLDVIGAIQNCHGNVSETARMLGVGRETVHNLHAAQTRLLSDQLPAGTRQPKTHMLHADSRAASFLMIKAETGFGVPRAIRSKIAPLIEQAKQAQLKGECFPQPSFDAEYEERFRRLLPPTLRTSNGQILLPIEESLFVVERYALSHKYVTKTGDPVPVVDRDLISWLAGEARGHGSGGPEDSVFARYGIFNPETQQTAKFTSHDIRHWLDTLYSQGGFTQVQIALMSGRNPSQNRVYDQTSSIIRKDRLAEQIRSGQLGGVIAQTYKRLAQFSIEQAEEYLASKRLRASLMPHGICMRNLRLRPCPHHLSCFAAKQEESGATTTGLCKDLALHKNDPETTLHLERLMRETNLSLSMIQPNDAQHQHFLDVKGGVSEALKITRTNNPPGI